MPRRNRNLRGRKPKRINPSCMHDGGPIPITALYRDLAGRLCHDHCGSPLAFERRRGIEMVFRCSCCFEHVYVPVNTLKRIPTRGVHRKILAWQSSNERERARAAGMPV